MIFQVDSRDAGQRLDNWLNAHLPDASRSRIQDWINRGHVKLNGADSRPSYKLRGGETIDVKPAEAAPLHAMAEAIPRWGAPRIHGELLKLGFEVAESTVSKYIIRRRGPPSQSWRTFLATMRTPLRRSICAWFQP